MFWRAIFKPVYLIVLRIYIFTILLLSGRKIKPDVRGSFLLDYFVPLSSDIDIDWYLSQHVPRKILLRCERAHRLFRNYVKIIGEVNLIFEEGLPLLAQVINPVERDKNPNLKKRISIYSDLSVGAAGRILFYIRSLDASKRDIFLRNMFKKGKWRWINRSCGLEPDNAPMDGFNRLMRSYTQEEDVKNISDDVETYFRLLYDGTDAPRVKNLVPTSAWSYSLFFHRYIYLKPIPKHLTEIQIDVIKNEILWECFGALTQHSFHKSKNNSPMHLSNLEQIYAEICKNFNVRNELIDILPEIRSFIERVPTCDF